MTTMFSKLIRKKIYLKYILLVLLTIYSLFASLLLFDIFNFSNNVNTQNTAVTRTLKTHSIIKLTNLNGIFIDLQRSAVFYSGEDILVLTFLVQSQFVRTIGLRSIRLTVRINDEIVLQQIPIDIYAKVSLSNKDYSFGIYRYQHFQTLCSLSSSSKCKNPINKSTHLTFQLIVNDKVLDESPINVIKPELNTNSILTVRLIKCMWMPSDVETFKFILNQSMYDSIYVCLFSDDHELKSILGEFESRQNINIIELESIPHIIPGREDLRSFKQILSDESIPNKFDFLDPALEFLLNQVYPFLIEKYRYVQAADYDFVLFTHGRTFYERIDEIVRKNQLTSNASLYFNQHWGIQNEISYTIFQRFSIYLEQRSIKPSDLMKLNSSDEFFDGLTYVNVPDFRFDLRIVGKPEWMHAINMLNYINAYMKSNSSDKLLRQVVLKFEQEKIFGQTVHNTKSSLTLKLCKANDYFLNGASINVENVHFIHYRDSYNFDLIKKRSRFIPVMDFVSLPDYEANNL